MSCWHLISPEDLFQLFDFVVRILLGARVVQKSSGICEWPSINLREDAEAISFFNSVILYWFH